MSCIIHHCRWSSRRFYIVMFHSFFSIHLSCRDGSRTTWIVSYCNQFYHCRVLQGNFRSRKDRFKHVPRSKRDVFHLCHSLAWFSIIRLHLLSILSESVNVYLNIKHVLLFLRQRKRPQKKIQFNPIHCFVINGNNVIFGANEKLTFAHPLVGRRQPTLLNNNKSFVYYSLFVKNHWVIPLRLSQTYTKH